ncbi:MAG: 1-phosphofructokinase [Phycisphaerales bacterium]|nr:1-phosphofructokinase [Phycisphaerales bacterium]
MLAGSRWRDRLARRRLVIITVTLNTAIDKTYTVENFVIDRVHRPVETKSTAGGKGINVARVLKELGREALATGFIGGNNGDKIIEGLDGEGIRHDFVRTAGESRICVAIVDPINRTQTEVNEIGPEAAPEDLRALKSALERDIAGADFIVLSGNARPGVPDDFYADIIALARRHNVRAVLDASGAHLSKGVAAGPFMVKPNVAELSSLRGRELLTREEIVHAAKALIASGTSVVVVSMGRAGCIATDGKRSWQAAPPEIQFVSAVGSGDALVAAFIVATLSGLDVPEAVRAGMAAGAANAMTFGAGFCTRESIETLKDRVHVVEI